MVVNAPQSNILSAAEQTMALLLAQARNIPQAHAASCRALGALEVEGWSSTARPSASSAWAGSARSSPSGPRLRHDPHRLRPVHLSERARAMGVELRSLDELIASRTSSPFTRSRPRDDRHARRDLLAKAKPGLRIINVGRGGIVDEEALAEAIRDGIVQGAGLDVFTKEPTTESPLFELSSVVVSPHLGASTAERRTSRVTIAEQVLLALAGTSSPTR